MYDKWSSYTPEEPGVCIAYTSVYGHTKAAAEKLAGLLRAKGVKVAISDLARDDMPEVVEDAFRYDRLVLATTTYNNGIFPFMHTFIEHLTEREYQNRTIAFIENGTWAPVAAKLMKAMFEKSKKITFAENTVTIKSALNADSEAALEKLAEELNSRDLPGVFFVPKFYMAMTYENPSEMERKLTLCDGVLIQIHDRNLWRPVTTQLHMMDAINKLFPDKVTFELDVPNARPRMCTDLICDKLKNHESLDPVIELWEQGAEEFKKAREKYLLY
jgi:flavodoxin